MAYPASSPPPSRSRSIVDRLSASYISACTATASAYPASPSRSRRRLSTSYISACTATASAYPASSPPPSRSRSIVDVAMNAADIATLNAAVQALRNSNPPASARGGLYGYELPFAQPPPPPPRHLRYGRIAPAVPPPPPRHGLKIGRSNDPPRRMGEWLKQCNPEIQLWHFPTPTALRAPVIAYYTRMLRTRSDLGLDQSFTSTHGRSASSGQYSHSNTLRCGEITAQPHPRRGSEYGLRDAFAAARFFPLGW
ncbi:hypothetical protein DFH07DRAFT_967646 [Mycena maculata]|uniref:Uncharacterized protein n=1 Tax=Mycena maculata TaxID=230809 RepID=A0AAD7HQD8_9AGAR|nr:hypothetical protein DFH07DRAFT_970711 [Mycena maculata]KAJ7734322.1 hypothetical protein DFH07DRAFT_967646 [Mycena maculata]